MAKRKTTKQRKVGELKLPESLSVDNSSELVQKFRELCENSFTLVAKSERPVSSVDLAGIQSLLYMKRYAAANNKTIQFVLDFDESAADLISKTGYADLKRDLSL